MLPVLVFALVRALAFLSVLLDQPPPEPTGRLLQRDVRCADTMLSTILPRLLEIATKLSDGKTSRRLGERAASRG